MNEELIELKKLTLAPEVTRLRLDKKSVTLTPPTMTGRQIVLDVKGEGRVFFATVQCNNKNAFVSANIDNREVSNTIAELYASGFRSWHPGAFWVSLYDTTNDNYVANFTPPGDGRKFNESALFAVDVDIPTKISYNVYWYEFVKPKE